MAEVPEPLSARNPDSFAYFTVKDRLPVILTKVIDALARDKEAIVDKYRQESREELKGVIGRLSKLKSDIQTDKPLPPIEDGREDAELWNACIREETEKVGSAPSWFTSAWLLVECYMYRKIKEAFELSPALRTHDPFAAQKEEAFFKSFEAEVVLAAHLRKITQEECGRETKTRFKQFLQLDLWGNKCDLSISAGVENSQKTNPLDELAGLEDFILADDTEAVWDKLQEANVSFPGSVRVDFVLDNAGFELFGDLCLADFLCSKNLAQKVVFHVKEVPWFVSDTMSRDFDWTLEQIKTSAQEPAVTECAKKWDDWVKSGRWQVRSHLFWTLPHDFSRMSRVAPDLYRELGRSQLLLFKGDLNYRKLTGDRRWDPTTAFGHALRGFQPTDLCALRTLKADLVVGLKPGQAESTQLRQENWMISGDFAVIQFHRPAERTNRLPNLKI